MHSIVARTLLGLMPLVSSALLVGACAPSGAARVDDAPVVPELVPLLEVPPAAVLACDAPGMNVEDLTARVRDALQAASGVRAVDQLSVKRELASCVEAPCPDKVASAYRDSRFIVSSSVTPFGSGFLASVRVARGTRELARASVEDARPQLSAERAARAAGALLRRVLLDDGASISAVDTGVAPKSEPGDPFGQSERASDG